ncbi:hypothetical protein D5045_02205 [Verminephrobacter eiseniae]|nr:hypothetical protein [Verminephrobacter eiseniae]
MTCQGCVKRVHAALVPFAETVTVNLNPPLAVLTHLKGNLVDLQDALSGTRYAISLANNQIENFGGDSLVNLSASALLTEAEWKGAYILAKKKPPTQPPTIREVIRQIAMLGGFLGRKCDGQPGVKSLWLGFARVRDFVQGVEHMRLLQDAGEVVCKGMPLTPLRTQPAPAPQATRRWARRQTHHKRFGARRLTCGSPAGLAACDRESRAIARAQAGQRY